MNAGYSNTIEHISCLVRAGAGVGSGGSAMDNKRRKEQSRQQKQEDKQNRRARREAEKRINPATTIDKDADLKDMVPGPQPGQIL